MRTSHSTVLLVLTKNLNGWFSLCNRVASRLLSTYCLITLKSKNWAALKLIGKVLNLSLIWLKSSWWRHTVQAWMIKSLSAPYREKCRAIVKAPSNHNSSKRTVRILNTHKSNSNSSLNSSPSSSSSWSTALVLKYSWRTIPKWNHWLIYWSRPSVKFFHKSSKFRVKSAQSLPSAWIFGSVLFWTTPTICWVCTRKSNTWLF